MTNSTLDKLKRAKLYCEQALSEDDLSREEWLPVAACFNLLGSALGTNGYSVSDSLAATMGLLHDMQWDELGFDSRAVL
jgi:CRISPR/Cas system-associated exonuclease Cas4 (RecB family)